MTTLNNSLAQLEKLARGRWTDMDGNSIDVGSRVQFWPTPAAYSWAAGILPFAAR